MSGALDAALGRLREAVRQYQAYDRTPLREARELVSAANYVLGVTKLVAFCQPVTTQTIVERTVPMLPPRCTCASGTGSCTLHPEERQQDLIP